MRFERAHLWSTKDGGIKVSATVEVPGIGMVEFQHALSDELCGHVCDETIAALRVRFGQKLPAPETETLNAAVIYVLAGNFDQAQEFAATRTGSLQYVRQENDLRGIEGSGKVLYVVGTAPSRDHFQECLDMAKARRFTIEYA